jgi:hypothetical protein
MPDTIATTETPKTRIEQPMVWLPCATAAKPMARGRVRVGGRVRLAWLRLA